MNIELVFDQDCPNVTEARDAIEGALRHVRAPLAWTEWDRAADATPELLRGYGSPTVLVNGRDVSDASDDEADANAAARADANSCRVYRDDAGRVRGAPSLEAIVAAITRSRYRAT